MSEKTVKKPEILSPAGNFEKMRSAILYGADAVYLAVRFLVCAPLLTIFH